MTDEMTSCEYVILAKREVFVYKIPPLTSKGYKYFSSKNEAVFAK
jgi:hypothetical protein